MATRSSATDTSSLSPCLPVSLSPCLPVSLSPCLPVSLSPCLPVSLSPCLPVSLSPSLPVSLSPCLPVSLSPCLPVSAAEPTQRLSETTGEQSLQSEAGRHWLTCRCPVETPCRPTGMTTYGQRADDRRQWPSPRQWS